ncbi:hypothetical protein DK847_14665 [Aestuariivirga litoralis]|uniref:Uncharacterized protein n=1 Tax=Aestuariivirga litoralis TaxID=2650924 RepID=A0A2W2B7Z9_9HYPH|nr:hypothetical protein [Aestuariivirga litoralis]PZF76414.1 hypothetical protein DK847_14665 [Aestuariivirga litoralis]
MSMLYAIAMAAGLGDEKPDTAKPNPVATKRQAAAPIRPAPAPMIETSEAKAYLATLASNGHKVSEGERLAILAYGEAWMRSADIRQEFSSFPVFAAYQRARKRNAFKILGQ